MNSEAIAGGFVTLTRHLSAPVAVSPSAPLKISQPSVGRRGRFPCTWSEV